jgi:hypothetical protein
MRIRGTIAVFSWKEWGKSRKYWVRMADVTAEIQIECLSNKSLKRHSYSNALGPN